MSEEKLHIKIISAGAGSGKTYRLTEEMVSLLAEGEVRPEGIIATTFTTLAATELRERVVERLLEKGMRKEAHRLVNALIGTVHGLGVKLLNRFAYEIGIPPSVNVMADEDHQYFFNQALSNILDPDRADAMDALAEFLNQVHPFTGKTFWRRQVKEICDLARVNKIDLNGLEYSKQQSIQTQLALFGAPSSETAETWNNQLRDLLQLTIERLSSKEEDDTKVTAKAIQDLKVWLRELNLREQFPWHFWAKLSKLKVSKKSDEEVEELKAFAERHYRHKQLHEDIRKFISMMFDLAADALSEYEQFKKQRGLIDYNDMETMVHDLLDHPHVQATLQEELDLLMVDEFQDTSPIQLAIFLKLSRLAKKVIWVGDPKQSIYGFRGAEPELMQTLLERSGGLDPENILTHSWRSREDIVYAVNAHFQKAFPFLPAEQVCLEPKRKARATEETLNLADEPREMEPALKHWHFVQEGEKPKPGNAEWFDRALAAQIKKWISGGAMVLPKGERKAYRKIRPGDVAILCRTNGRCMNVADALSKMGLRAAIYRAGLLETREIRLLLACVKYLLSRRDALAASEILLLASEKALEDVVDSRLRYLYKENGDKNTSWEADDPFLKTLDSLRAEVAEFSASELLQLLQDRLDLRRIVLRWGHAEQRLANMEMLMQFALQYEARCDRLHSAASVGGLLLWLHELAKNKVDWQGFSKDDQAVKVLTYHRSKGLEFSAVICYELEAGLREDGIWQLQVVPPDGPPDTSDILSGRWIRFWVNPYGRQLPKTFLHEQLKDSIHWKNVQEQNLREMARLLYVGMTRARDYLIFPTRHKKAALWLDLTYHEGKEGPPVLDPDSSETPWVIDGNPLLKQNEHLVFPENMEGSELQTELVQFLRSPADLSFTHQPYHVVWKEMQGECKREKIFSYAGALLLLEEDVCIKVAEALKSLIASARLPLIQKTDVESALARFGVEQSSISVDSLLNRISAFQKNWKVFTSSADCLHRYYPVRMQVGEQFAELTLESVWVNSNKEMFILQTDTETRKPAAKCAAWRVYSAFLEKHLPRIFPEQRFKGLYLNFPFLGEVFKV